MCEELFRPLSKARSKLFLTLTLLTTFYFTGKIQTFISVSLASQPGDRNCLFKKVEQKSFRRHFNGMDYNDFKQFDYGVSFGLGECDTKARIQNYF